MPLPGTTMPFRSSWEAFWGPWKAIRGIWEAFLGPWEVISGSLEDLLGILEACKGPCEAKSSVIGASHRLDKIELSIFRYYFANFPAKEVII